MDRRSRLLPGGRFDGETIGPIQQEIEELIRSFLPDYRYGVRREDQTPIIEAGDVRYVTRAWLARKCE